MAVRCVGLIPAAGQGARLGGETPKQYLDLAGRPMLAHAAAALLAHPAVDLAFVVLAPDDERWATHDWHAFGDRLAPLWCGGATRRDSVLNGLIAMANVVDPEDWVLVHDAARPCLAREDLGRLIEAVREDDVGGILAIPDRSDRAARRALARADATDVSPRHAPPRDRGCGARHRRSVRGRGNRPAAAARAGKRAQSQGDLSGRRGDGGAALEGRQMRIGQGFDVHALVTGRKLVVGGVEIPFEKGLAGHSDADVLLHAIADALLGAAGLGDIGRHFPDTDPAFRDADSRRLLREAVARVRAAGYAVANVDATIIAQAPRMAPHIPAMTANIAADLGVGTDRVNVKAKTTERLGFAGRGEGIAAEAVALLDRA
jgi:2-C-methyl-D-erythritol 4-phosphate cytidylyltransferase/2-C-methyl-D-erythritol 2,4-cyclodiphosphate synthase